MTAEHDAFLLGRIAGEDALDLNVDDRRALQIFKERRQQLQDVTPDGGSILVQEFQDGWDFVMKSHLLPNYTRVPEHGRVRAFKLLAGEPPPEELPAVLHLDRETVTKVHRVLNVAPGISMDELLDISLDAFIICFEQTHGTVIQEGLTMENVAQRIADAIVPKVRRA